MADHLFAWSASLVRVNSGTVATYGLAVLAGMILLFGILLAPVLANVKLAVIMTTALLFII